MINRTSRICALAVSLAMLSPGSAALADVLAGSEWQPLQLDGRTVADADGLFVRFGAEGRVAGSGGCNRFSGSYTIAEGQLFIAPLGTTRMACPDTVMELERIFLQVLAQVRSFSRERTRLVLGDAQGNLRARLRQTDWD